MHAQYICVAWPDSAAAIGTDDYASEHHSLRLTLYSHSLRGVLLSSSSETVSMRSSACGVAVPSWPALLLAVLIVFTLVVD